MLSALSFLSVVGRSAAPGDRTFRWFPVAGALIGGFVAAAWWLAQRVWNPSTAAAIAIAADLAITGLLHFDGLADSADGLLPHLDRGRRLEVMRQPDVGAFALAIVPCVMLLRWTALASGRPSPWSVVAIWSISRTLVAVVPSFVPYARSGGLASSFLGGSSRWILIALAPAAVLLAAVQGAVGVAAALVGAATVAAVIAMARQRLGGFTGDVLGAAIVLSETTALLTLAAR